MAGGWRIRVAGLVQGVGFRPTVWQVATGLGIAGRVRNTAAGVTIEIAGGEGTRDDFLQALRAALPPLARIDTLTVEPCEVAENPAGFEIAESEGGAVSAAIVADAMLCPACAADIADPGNRRFRYAFTNCTHCGPRLSIIRRIPYDRAHTAMAAFPMCSRCAEEYANPADRRYHAEPIACADCGPKLWLETAPGVKEPDPDPLEAAARLILDGRIVAIKGLGGFHLACLAGSEESVQRLRQRKRRPSKPLALMVGHLEQGRRIARIDEAEAGWMGSRQGPILLLAKRDDAPLAPSVAPRQDRIGIMLPTTPLHALLMERVAEPLVMTSANEAGFPQCIENEEARALLGSIADALLLHDRDILARVDDSVVRLDRTGPTVIRRARGFAPEPFCLPAALSGPASVFAAGADMKAAFAFAGAGTATLSQYLGDLDTPETRMAYEKAASLYASIFERKPALVAVDSHPSYASGTLGRALAAAWEAPVLTVQHHHAHLASCLAENGWAGGQALGVILDGTGYGADGTIWGGEFLAGDYAGFERLDHFPAVALIGGDRAALEPWRNAFAHLLAAFGPDALAGRWRTLDCIRALQARDGPALRSILEARRLSPLSSSAGRLFDAVAYILGIAPARLDYEGQAGMELEALAGGHMREAASLSVPPMVETRGWAGLWAELLDGLLDGQPAGLLAARFHHLLCDRVVQTAWTLCRGTGLQTVALSGGVFQNRLLLEGISEGLEKRGLTVLTHTRFPANDGGIALGQAAIACHAARR